MVFQVFIALIFMTAAMGLYFVPRNRHVGFRTKHTFSSDKVWTKTNRFAAILFALAGAALLYFSNRGFSNEDFYFIVFISIFAIAFLGMRYGLSLARDIPEEACKPEAKASKKKNAKRKKQELVFSENRKMSLFYSLFCAALVGVSYIWILQCLSFMPEDMAFYNNLGERVALGFDFHEYSLVVRFSFFAALIICALAFVACANYYKRKPCDPLPYSLKLSLSDIFFAYAASLALLIATANYAFYRSAASSRASADEIFSMLLPLLGIVIVWFALFKINRRLSSKS